MTTALPTRIKSLSNSLSAAYQSSLELPGIEPDRNFEKQLYDLMELADTIEDIKARYAAEVFDLMIQERDADD